MKKYQQIMAVASTALVLVLAACSNNNTDAVHNERDTNLLDTRRNTDTTNSYLTGDSAGPNQTPASGGTGPDQ